MKFIDRFLLRHNFRIVTSTIFVMHSPLLLAALGESSTFPLSLKADAVRTAGTEEVITYSTAWDGTDDSTVTLAQNGVPLARELTGEGALAWTAGTGGTYVLTHTTYDEKGEAGKVETATFIVTNGISFAQAETEPFRLSLQADGMRSSSGEETLTYSSLWDGGETATVTLTQDGATLTSGLVGEGEQLWHIAAEGTYELTHTTYQDGNPGKIETATFVVEKEKPLPVTFTPVSGTKFDTSLSVALSCASPGVVIHYTTDGSTPTLASPVYRRFRISGKTTVKAIAFFENGTASEMTVAEYAFGRCADPVITAADSFSGSKTKIEIACTTPGATIRYTLNGKDPNSHSSRYTGAFFLAEGCTIKAIALQNDYWDSAVVSKTVEKVWGIGDTLGKPDHAFTTGGDAPFTRVADATASSGESMRSGVITDNQKSILSTTVVGPGTLSFKWKTSCELDDDLHDWDHAVCTVDGVEIARLDGKTEWVKVSHAIAGSGVHTIIWTYMKDDIESDGEDCLWISDYDWVSKFTETQTTEVPVPYAWLLEKCPETVDEYEVYERVAKSAAANPRYTVMDCYVAGLDPELPTDEFQAWIEMDAKGKPIVTWKPVLEPAEAAKRVYTIYGQKTLDANGVWTDVSTLPEPEKDKCRFFKVGVWMAR